MTLGTTSWAWEQELPCAPKMLLIAMVDLAGSCREFSANVNALARRCGLTSEEVASGLEYLSDAVMIQINKESQSIGGVASTVRLLFPIQDFEDDHPTSSPPPKSWGQSGFLYIAAVSYDTCKVGITTNLDARIRSLDNSSALNVRLVFFHECKMQVAAELERRILRKFSQQSIKGEWIRADASDLVAFATSQIEEGITPG